MKNLLLETLDKWAVVLVATAAVGSCAFYTAPVTPKGCQVWGDSIAVGVSWYAPDRCTVDATVGISSRVFFAGAGLSTTEDLVVISIGSNDGRTDPTIVRKIGDLVEDGNAVWLLPINSDQARGVVAEEAARAGDRTIDLRMFMSGDGVHPSSYKAVADAVWIGGVVE